MWYASKEMRSAVSCSVLPEKIKDSDLGITHEKVDIPKQKKPRLNEILLDENFEKLDEP
jgi:hypothetical protein